MRVELLSHTINPEQIIATAAKLCYSSSEIKDLLEKQTPERIESFLKRLPSGHQSILEHASFTFAIEGVSRVTEVQLVRHRISSFSVQSGRYVKRNKVEFIEPPRIKNCYGAHKIYEDICAKSNEAYNKIVIELIWDQIHPDFYKLKIEEPSHYEKINEVSILFDTDKETYKKYEKRAIEDARYAHLQATPTRIICTMNLRSLKHFFNERCCARAQWEIRAMANQMLKICKEKFPLLFKDAGPKCILTNSCPEGKMTCGKVFKAKIDDNEIPKYNENKNRIGFVESIDEMVTEHNRMHELYSKVDITNKILKVIKLPDEINDNIDIKDRIEIYDLIYSHGRKNDTEHISDEELEEFKQKILESMYQSAGLPPELMNIKKETIDGKSKYSIGVSSTGIGEIESLKITRGDEEPKRNSIGPLDVHVDVDKIKDTLNKRINKKL